MKEYLFAYGTLQDTAVQQYVFQRPLEGQPDTLPGYVISTKKMYDRYLVLEPGHKAGDEVHGMSYRLGAQDLLKADVYEGPAYTRIRLSLKSGRMAWVYLEKTRAEQAE
jgi:gamma-glutamylcyclotransferase (GGCT)/AIG2-like uncharacterized protein YtfP